MTFLPVCWLVPGDPGPFQEPFNRSYDDYKIFQNWFSILTSVSKPQDIIDNLVLTYQTIVDSNRDLFSINCLEARPLKPLHKKMKVDVSKTIFKLRKAHDLSLAPTDQEEMIENVISRILLYAHFSEIEYRQGFCELVLPIFHVYFYGVLGSEDIPFRVNIIEAIVADSFVRFMTGPLINHLRYLPPAKDINTLTNSILDLLRPYPIYQMIESNNIDPKHFAFKWIILVFVQDLEFTEVIKIWDHLISNCTKTNFHKLLVSLCAGAALSRELKCSKAQPYQVLETIQEIDDLIAEEIIFRAP